MFVNEAVKDYEDNLEDKLEVNNESRLREQIEDTFVRGAICGYNKATEWHDLRKNPSDIPEQENEIYSKEVWVFDIRGRYHTGIFSYGLYAESGSLNSWVGTQPIAWCEIPQFKEQKL